MSVGRSPPTSNALLSDELGAKVTHATRRAVARPSDCVPDGTVLLSTFNEYHLPLHRMQFRAVQGLRCLMSRVVLLCFGSAAPHEWRGACVQAPTVQRSDHKRGDYHLLTWVKWTMAFHAMRAARAVLMIDADCVIVRNPFTPAVVARSDDLLYQEEFDGHFRQPFTSSVDPLARACVAPWCTGNASRNPAGAPAWQLRYRRLMRESPLNTGQLYVRSPALVDAILRTMPPTADADPRLEQVVVFQDVLAAGRFRASSLPASFAGHCWFKPDRSPTAWCGVVTYHTHCLHSLRDKEEWMGYALGNVSSERCARPAAAAAGADGAGGSSGGGRGRSGASGAVGSGG